MLMSNLFHVQILFSRLLKKLRRSKKFRQYFQQFNVNLVFDLIRSLGRNSVEDAFCFWLSLHFCFFFFIRVATLKIIFFSVN